MPLADSSWTCFRQNPWQRYYEFELYDRVASEGLRNELSCLVHEVAETTVSFG